MSNNADSGYLFDISCERPLHDSDKNIFSMSDGLWSKMNEQLRHFDYGSKHAEAINQLLAANKLSAPKLQHSCETGFSSNASNERIAATSIWNPFAGDHHAIWKNGDSKDCWKLSIGASEQNGVDLRNKMIKPSASQSVNSNSHMSQYSSVDNGTALWRQSLRSPSLEQNSLNASLDHVQLPVHSAQPKTRKIPQSRSELIKKLIDIGFQKEEAQAALIHSNMDMTLALVKLLSNQRNSSGANPHLVTSKPYMNANGYFPNESTSSTTSFVCSTNTQVSGGSERNFGPIGSGIYHTPANRSMGQSGILNFGVGGFGQIVNSGSGYNGSLTAGSSVIHDCGPVGANLNKFDVSPISPVDRRIDPLNASNSYIMEMLNSNQSQLKAMLSPSPNDNLTSLFSSVGHRHSFASLDCISPQGDSGIGSSSTGISPYSSTYSLANGQHGEGYEATVDTKNIDQQVKTATSTKDMNESLTSSANSLSIREFIPGQLWTSAKSNSNVDGASSSPPKSYVSQPDEFTYGMVNNMWMAPVNTDDDTSAWILDGELNGTGSLNCTDGMYRYGWSLGNNKDETEFKNFI